MNREILFRGKRVDNGEWVYGYILEQNIPEYHCYIVKEFKAEVDNRNIDIIEADLVEVIPETVGQYTGLCDKNGKRIFEGDIVKDTYLFGAVVFGDNQDYFGEIAGFMIDDVYDGLQDYNGLWHGVEVIDNTHDNQELLEVQE